MSSNVNECKPLLRGRGTEKEASILTRMNNAKKEMAKASVRGFFHKVIVNENLEKAYVAGAYTRSLFDST